MCRCDGLDLANSRRYRRTNPTALESPRRLHDALWQTKRRVPDVQDGLSAAERAALLMANERVSLYWKDCQPLL